jgi:hypothetical protein
MIIRIRHLLALRPQVRDQALLDYLQLITLAPAAGASEHAGAAPAVGLLAVHGQPSPGRRGCCRAG